LGKRLQDGIAIGVTKPVIVLFEPINVEHYQGERAAVALGAVYLSVNHFIEVAAIV